MLQKILLPVQTYTDLERTVRTEVLVPLREFGFLEIFHNLWHKSVRVRESVPAARHLLDRRGTGEGIRGGAAVSPDKSRDTEFYPPEIAYDYNQDVTQAGGIYLGEDLSSGASGRFPVIIGPPYGAVESQPVSITVMPGIVIFLSGRVHQLTYLSFIFNRICQSYEAAAVILV